MKKYVSTLLTITVALCIGMHSASASLLGMPLNLKIVIELRDVAAPAPASEFYTDDVFAGPVAGQGLLIALTRLDLVISRPQGSLSCRDQSVQLTGPV
jgi:hypothetical protein